MIGSDAVPASRITSGVDGSWLQSAVACLAEGVLLLDEQGAVAFISPPAAALLGDVAPGLATSGDLRAALRRAIADGGLRPEPGEADAWLAMAGGMPSRELVAVTLAGRWLRLRARPLPQGRAMVLVADVTAERLHEARLAAECEALRQQARQLVEANAAAEARARELEGLAYVDALTGLLNRRRLAELAPREIRLARRHERPLAVLLVDIDRFKRVNDRFGHGAGDEALRQVAQACASGLRATDLLARWGGEELVAILPQTDLEGAVSLGERLRRRVAAGRYGPDGRKLRLTVSVGTTALKADDRSLGDLIARCDAALYAAKRSGRNRVERAA